MKPSLLLWILAVLITLASASYQRLTGPTHPISGKVELAGRVIPWTLERSHGGAGGQEVRIAAGPGVTGSLEWKRFGSLGSWIRVGMRSRDGQLVAELPHQPPAGKLLYRVALGDGVRAAVIPPRAPAVIRFKGDVPPAVLIPHILVMFAAMLFSTRAGIESFMPDPKLKALTLWTLALLVVGGMILGPLVVKSAFGMWWTGFPVGTDVTDNKTLAALVGWIAATVAVSRARRPKGWVLFASVLMLVVFLIPHSLGGTSLDYDKLERGTGAAQTAR